MISFQPDLPESAPDLLLEVEAIPTVRGYAGSPSQIGLGYSALAATCTGAALMYRLDGATRLLSGTQSKLYEGSGGIWTDVSRGLSYVTGDTKWRFAQYGNTSFAVSQVIQLQTSTVGAFADVANAPKASLMESVSGFIMLANTDDTGTGLATGYGAQQHRWWCSQLFNPTGTWAPSVTTQATSGLLVSAPGPITGMKRLGDSCVIYKARAIYLGQYVGPPEVWKWDLVPGEIGVGNNECVVSIGTSHLFIGFEDIYQFDGSRPVAIGQGIKEWFFSNLNKNYTYKIEGVHDYNNQCVWWFYPKGTATTLTAAIVYNYRIGKWGHVTMSIECPLISVVGGVTYDGFGALYATYNDTPEISYDSPFWQGGAPILTVIDNTHTIKSLTGTSATGYIKTGWIGNEDIVSTCTRVRPKYSVKPATAVLTPSTCMSLGDVATTNAAGSINGDRFDLLQAARWHQFKVDFTGQFEIEGMAPTLIESGHE